MTIEKIKEKIIEITQQVLESRGLSSEINVSIPLSEEGLGLDSIGLLTLLSEIEKKMKLDFPEKFWGSTTFQNLTEIIEYIHQNPNKNDDK